MIARHLHCFLDKSGSNPCVFNDVCYYVYHGLLFGKIGDPYNDDDDDDNWSSCGQKSEH